MNMLIDEIDFEQSLTAAHEYIGELQKRVLNLEKAMLVLTEWPNGLHEYVSALITYNRKKLAGEYDDEDCIEQNGSDPWISVTEKLPTDYRSVYCARYNSMDRTFNVVEGYYGSKMGWSHDNVVYWMPKPRMPEPPARCK